jgi:hypothetical protein
MTLGEDHSLHDVAAKKAILQNIEQYGCHLTLLESIVVLPSCWVSISHSLE